MPLPGFGSAITASELRKKRLAAQRPTNYGPYSSPSAYAAASPPSGTPYSVTTDPLRGPNTTTTTFPLAPEQRYPIPTQRSGLDARQRRPKPRTTKVKVPEIVPPKYRKAVAKQGQRLNEPLQEAGIDMSGPEYLAKLIQFESGWNKRAENPSSAYGFGQFIDSTAQDFRERLGVETQDPKRPRQMIKGASMHASGDFGYNPLYAGYNPGYSDTDPILSVESGRNVNVRAPRKAIKRLSEGVDAPASGGTPSKRPGPWAGSKAIVRELLGPYAKTQDWKDKEDRGDPGGTLHDIGTKNAFAADLDPDEEIVDQIARKLSKENPGINPRTVDYGRTGLESGLTYKGYDVEWLPYTHGSGPHNHLGIEWTGGSPPPGTRFGGSTGGSTGGAAPAAGGGPASPASDGGFGPYAEMVQNQIARIRRSPLAPSAPQPAARKRLRSGEEEEEEEGLREILSGARFKPQRRIAI